MEPIEPPATPSSKTLLQHEPADGGDAASGTIDGLPFHLTERILRCVSPLESAPFAAVCRSWAATVSERLATPTPHLFALEVLDGDEYFLDLLFVPDLERIRGAIFSVPVDDEDSPAPVIPARLPAVVSHAEDDNIKLSGALPCGGLSFSEDNRVVLVNPVTGAFQSIKMYPPRHTHLFPPTVRAAAGTDAFFVCQYFERTVCLRWREEEWSEQNLLLPEEFTRSDAIDLVAYSGGIFYAMEFFGFTHTVDTRAPPPWRLTRLRAPSILEQYSPICRYRYLRNSHLLESEGEVMFVGPVLTPDEPLCPKTIRGFEVYKLDLERSRWVKVERLADDRALFVSQQSSFSVRASETPGCRSNCIYFVSEFDETYIQDTWGVYSMEEQKVLFQGPVGGSPGKYKAARWFFPRAGASPARTNCAISGKKRNFQML
ncbi:hypothetical protein ACQJBY_062697 [Aegilops geniculata]